LHVLSVFCVLLCFVFFFSSRRRHTRFSRDWSSDVCSSDLVALGLNAVSDGHHVVVAPGAVDLAAALRERGFEPHPVDTSELLKRSEERRVGKEWRSRWAPEH